MDEIISFLMRSIMPALLGTGMNFGMSQLLSPHQPQQRGPVQAGVAQTPSAATPAASSSMPGTEGLTGAGAITKPTAIGNFMGGTTGGLAAPSGGERPVSSGFSTLTPNPFGSMAGGLRRPPSTSV